MPNDKNSRENNRKDAEIIKEILMFKKKIPEMKPEVSKLKGPTLRYK